MELQLRRDLTEDQVIRLLRLTYIKAPRDWWWLLGWATGSFPDITVIAFSGGTEKKQADRDDTEAVVSAYENPLLWDKYKEE